MSQLHGQPPSVLPAAFGRYRLLKLLGQGGMGSVYLAHDDQLDRPVALKIPRLNAAGDRQILNRFYAEARAAAVLHHPNLCPVYDVGEIDGVPYLTMAYVDGKPLDEITRGRRLNPRQVAVLVGKLALALSEAHKRGVTHRDLKPANVMIDRRGEPVVMDFGLARRTREGDPRLTREGSAMGTPAYMAPEQVQGQLDAMGPACDIYSLGVILYELLAGRLPFVGDVMTVMAQVLLEEPAPPSRFRPDVAPDQERICLKAMAKKAEDRHASMTELAEEMHAFLSGKTTLPESAEGAKDELPVPRNDKTSPLLFPAARGQDREPPPDGFRVSQMGGARSVAQLHAKVPPAKPHGHRARRRGRQKGTSWLPIGLGLGGATFLLTVIGWVVFHTTDYGTIRLDLGADARGVAIQVDGTDWPADSEQRLRAGTHVLSVSGNDYEADQIPFVVRRGRNEDLHVTLRRREPVPVVAAVTKPLPPQPEDSLRLIRKEHWENLPTEGVLHSDAAPRGDYLLASLTSYSGQLKGLRVWKVVARDPAWQTKDHYWARFSPDGELVYTLETGNIVRAYRTDTGKKVREVVRLPDQTFSFYLSADGRFLLAQHPGAKTVWRVTDGQRLYRWEGDGGLTADGKHFMKRRPGDDRFRYFRLDQLPNLVEAPLLSPPDGFEWVNRQPAGQYAIAGKANSKPEDQWLIEANGRKLYHWVPKSCGKVLDSLHWANGQDSLVSLEDGTIRLLDVVNGKQRSRFPLDEGEKTLRMELSPGLAYATVVTSKSRVLLFKVTGPPAND